ncbi:MAG: [FeFe] hydrogenase H-cluster maturation GTPase HydF [Defluviitaleaceae bacterium]|nr:[FeFe] hydrogenase H-cluster maturation GTPase HydF [Defluviitaleaceae bacterium]
MTTTPRSNRLHVGIFGEVNSGKSSLFNKIIGANASIVSATMGTTTDPVQKSMELLPFGPIVLVDTAGYCDESTLGEKRQEQTKKIMRRSDFAIYVIDATKIEESQDAYDDFAMAINDIPHIVVLSKIDAAPNASYGAAIKTSTHDSTSIYHLKTMLAKELAKLKDYDDNLLGETMPYGSTIVMVTSLDSAAPKGRLVLPQVQLIRDCQDNGCISCVTTIETLPNALQNINKVDLVVTDSQLFGEVSKIVPNDVALTSFSILMAKQKGNIEVLLDGVNAVSSLEDGDRVLVSEVCAHTITHEDIGEVKIPGALKNLTGKDLQIDFVKANDYPDDLSEYSLIVHCGACMITPRDMKTRIELAQQANVPITNYGLLLAKSGGILERCVEFLKM